MQPSERIEQLKQLNRLLQSGIITREEFNTLKRKVLNQGNDTVPPEDAEQSAHADSSPEQTEPEQTEPEQTEPEQTEPEQTEPEQTEPEQTEPEQTEPEPANPQSEQPASHLTSEDIGNTVSGFAKRLNTKAALIAGGSIVGAGLLTLLIFLLLPLHTKISIKSKLYPSMGKNVVLCSTNHDDPFIVYYDDKQMTYEGRIGKRLVMYLNSNNYHRQFYPMWTNLGDSISVKLEYHGGNKQSGVDEHPDWYTYHYVGDRCLIAESDGLQEDGKPIKAENAILIQFRGEPVISHVEWAEFVAFSKEPVRICVTGELDNIGLPYQNRGQNRNSILKNNGWNIPGAEDYLDYSTIANYDPLTGNVGEVEGIFYSELGTFSWEAKGHVFPTMQLLQQASSTISGIVDEQLVMNQFTVEEFIEKEHIRQCQQDKEKEYLYPLRMYVERVYNRGDGYVLENESFMSCDTYVYTNDPDLINLPTPCWVTMKARFDYYDSGFFTPTLRMKDAQLLSY